MGSISIFSYIMAMVPEFTIFFICSMFVFKLILTNINRFFFSVPYDFCCLFVTNFIFCLLKPIISISCFLEDSQNVFMQFFPLYILCLFSMLSNDNIADIKTSDGVCSPNFAVDTFSGLFLHPSIFSIQDLPEK